MTKIYNHNIVDKKISWGIPHTVYNLQPPKIK